MTKNVQIVKDSTDFFRECVRTAAVHQNQMLNHNIEYYLVMLLHSYMKLDSTEEEYLDKPLVLMMQEALETSANNSLSIYKKIGDQSLYISGFFKNYFLNKLYSKDYYMSMGKTAYKFLSTHFCKMGDQDFYSLYRDMLQGFDSSVLILEDISTSLKGLHNQHDHLAIQAKANSLVKKTKPKTKEKVKKD